MGRSGTPSVDKHVSLGESSVDDRISFRRDESSGPYTADDGTADGATATDAAAAASSDWLLAGETARAGMIDSVSAENSGRPGTKVVDDGVFQTRLLCPSQVGWLSFVFAVFVLSCRDLERESERASEGGSMPCVGSESNRAEPAGRSTSFYPVLCKLWAMAFPLGRLSIKTNVGVQKQSKKRGQRPLTLFGSDFARRFCPFPQILSDAAARALARHLPGTVGSSDWVSLYSNARHGSSLKTLLARCAGWQPTLVVVEACAPSPRLRGERIATAERNVSERGGGVAAAAGGGVGRDAGVAFGEVGGDTESARQRGEGTTTAAAAMEGAVTFGGFASGSQWKNMGRAFSGDGGCFLFTFDREAGGMSISAAGEHPSFEEEGENRGGGGSAGYEADLQVYPWARKDRCFMTSDDGVGVGMGGGGDGGGFGFLLSEDLRSGSTGRCETFQNPPLIQTAELSGGVGRRGAVFDVLSVEVWGFRAAKASEGLTRIAL